MKYENPILKGFYPDPSIVCVNDTFYLINSTFEYLPGIPIHKSKDLIHWETINHCITRDSQINLGNCNCSCGIFAPTLRYHSGTFYMITTDIGRGTFLLTTKDIEKDWSDPIFISTEGYDPSLFFDDDGSCYMQITMSDDNGLGIYQVPIDVSNGKLLDSLHLLWRGTGGRDPEGPHIFKREKYYYLNIAEGGTREGHMITLARSTSLYGPFDSCPDNPVITNREEAGNPLQAVGHADYFVDFNGNWWIVALCQRMLPHYFHILGRETILVPIVWTESGWPLFGTDGHVYENMEGPLPTSYPYVPKLTDDFNTNVLDLQWIFLRDFLTEQYDLDTRPGWIHLLGSNKSLDDLDSPTFIARRQQDFTCSFRCFMEFIPDEGCEAGLCILSDNEHHFELSITKTDDITSLILRKNVADLKVISNVIPLKFENNHSNYRIYLEIKCTADQYYFNYSHDGVNYVNLGFTYTKHLSTEATKSDFTGVVCGMYAYTSHPDKISSAYFDWFQYIPDTH